MSHFAANRIAMFLRTAFASFAIMPSVDATKGEKFFRISKHFFAYFFLFSSSCNSNTWNGVYLLTYEDWSVSVRRTSRMQSVLLSQSPRTRRSPRKTEGGCELLVDEDVEVGGCVVELWFEAEQPVLIVGSA